MSAISNKKLVTVLDVITHADSEFDMRLVCVVGQQGLDRNIARTVNRPGLALNGMFIGFDENRIQLFGRGEVAFLHMLESEGKLQNILDQFFSHINSCCIVSHADKNIPPKMFVDYCERDGCPLLYSNLSSVDLSSNLYSAINELFAPQDVFHGVFLEVHDLGVLIQGKSGIGKSEIALELIEKNKYRLIADDSVLMKRIDHNTVIGTASGRGLGRYRHSLEIRGLGLVNIAQIYGIGVTLNSRKLDMIVDLKPWDEEEMRDLERLERGQTKELLGVTFPYVSLPVKVGRNVSLLIEIAAIKHRLISMGYHGKENIYLW